MTAHEAFHGGIDLKELARAGVNVADAIDFSSNILPHGPSPRVLEAVRHADLASYPDRECTDLRGALARHWGIGIERLTVGNGASELIHLIATVMLRPQSNVLIVGPTFSEYERASTLAQAKVHGAIAQDVNQFAIPLAEVERSLIEQHPSLVWICNPNNPTGKSLPADQLLSWIRKFPESVFVIDESYIEFATQTESLVQRLEPNLIVLRSLTKSYGIAGLRLGIAVTSVEWIERLHEHRVPWSVNAAAQLAGIAAIDDRTYYDTAIRETISARARMMDSLRDRGFDPIATDANYFLLPCQNVKRIRERLLSSGLVVRDCESFGLTDHLRIAVLDPASNQRLVDQLSQDPASTPAMTSTRASAVVDSPSDDEGVESERHWDDGFRRSLKQLFRLRRDVRRFRTEPIPATALKRWVEAACLAPSVGLSQPWRFVSVNDPVRRQDVAAEFSTQNGLARDHYDSETANQYQSLKLAGLREAPEHLAVFVEPDPSQGRGLGRMTMPESVAYSVVAAIQNLWLAARSEGVGIGWVSILRPESINQILDVPDHWQLIAYLCIGYPELTDVVVPELETSGWEQREPLEAKWTLR